MTRILMLVTNDINPDPRVEREASALAAQGYEVRIVGMVLGCGSKSFAKQKNGYSALNIGVCSYLITRVRQGWIQAFLKIIEYSIKCLRSANLLLERVSVVHAHDFDTLPIGYVLSRLFNTKLVFDAHESYSEMFSEKVPRIIVRLVDALEIILSKRADRIIASGELLGKRMEAISGMNVDVVQNTVSELFGSAYTHKNTDDFVLGYIGGFLYDRNLIELIQAFRIFSSSHRNVKLILAGWGPLSEHIEKEAMLNPNSIDYRGKINYNDVPKTISELSLSVVFLSRKTRNNYYSTPNKVFESVSLGVPVLGSGFGELKRIITNYRLGTAIDSSNIDAIVKKLDELYGVRQELMELGERAKQTFIAELSWERILKKLLQLYNDLDVK